MPYSTVNGLLEQIHPQLCAAEAHGIAVGMLCANPQTAVGRWLAELLGQQTLQADENLILTRLFEETQRLLACDAFQFALFLPSDDELLPERLQALKSWCQGFLFGMGCGQANRRLGPEVQGILKDIAEFTKLDTDAEGEENEVAFTELTEYLRSAVLLLRDELEGDNNGISVH